MGTRIGIVALIYALTAWLSHRFTFLHDDSCIIWLPAGIALGLTYWWGYRVGIVGVWLGTTALMLLYDRPFVFSVLSGLPHAAQAAIAVMLLRSLNLSPRLDRPQDVVRFVGAAMAASLVAPLLNLALRTAYGMSHDSFWFLSLLHRWMGDFVGALVAGGFLLVWWNNGRMRKRDYIALLLLTLATMTAVWLGFYLSKTQLVSGPTLIIILPTLVASAFLYRQRGVSLQLIAIVIMLSQQVLQWQRTNPIQLPELMVGWIFSAISFCVFMTVASVLSLQQTYAKALEETQRETEMALQQVRTILENAPSVAMQIYDTQGRILFWNQASEKFYGFSETQALGKTLESLIFTPEQQTEFLQALQQVARTECKLP
ncbi:MAG: hypothetical protein KatS3mg020_0018 [Fimbriimonadales bacterium]|nr:MAG: hypothetical protein KatS3mg020_0018 [Fimbriimonadales bacterium]